MNRLFCIPNLIEDGGKIQAKKNALETQFAITISRVAYIAEIPVATLA